MKMKWVKGGIGCLVLSLLGGCLGGPVGEGAVGSAEEASSTTTYSGRAAVLGAKVVLVNASLGDTGALAPAGGTKNVALLAASVPGILTADAVDAFVTGQNGHTLAQSEVAGVGVGLAAVGINISAGVLETTASAQCSAGNASVGAASVITGLVINGQSITVTGAPNQTINLLVGKVVINERSSSVSGGTATIHNAALHVTVAGLVDVTIASADAGITCAPLPPPPPAPTCTDGLKNGYETDVDCGGPTCAPCGDGHTCAYDGDCASAHCDSGVCVTPPPPPTCTDGIQNGQETDVDCGGPTCAPCGDGHHCGVDADCQSSFCDAGTCAPPPPPPPTCTDGIKNGDETDVDCGGSTCAPCGDGQQCGNNGDCQTGFCADGTCAPPPPTCTDGIKNGDEADVDCGGSTCAPCGDGQQCGNDGDCQTGYCAGGTCAPPPPTCTDGIKNGYETGVDCGGPSCGPCSTGGGCATNADCLSGDCEGGTCVCTPVDYITGQGYITSTPSKRLGTFSLYGEIVNGVPTGHVNYDDDGSSEHLQSTDVTAYTVIGPHTRRIQGHATMKFRTGTFTYTVDATDNGAGSDVFTISISDGYTATGIVASGDEALTVNVCQ